jgi:Protein of unknown function (DUF3300)
MLKQIVSLLLAWFLVIATCPLDVNAQASSPAAPQATAESTQRLEQLVAPIALYPDALVAQILAGATYPTQIVEADRWVKQNSTLKGEELGTAVNAQPWDESVKALTQFPSVLDNMSTNLSWTSALGDAFFNEPEAVTAMVQKLRKQAQAAGNLKTTKEQTVTTEAQTIVIQPANPQVVYVPVYNPTIIYGAPIVVYPAYRPPYMGTVAVVSFGTGFVVFGGPCCIWGWSSWGYGWHGGTVIYRRNVYVSHTNVYINRNSYYRHPNNYPRPTPYGNNTNINRGGNTINKGGNTINVNPGNKPGTPSTLPAGNRGNSPGNAGNKPGTPSTLPAGSRPGGTPSTMPAGNRGYGQTKAPGTGSTAFSGYTPGGNAAAQQSRGSSSLGGGGKAPAGGKNAGGRR